MTDTQTVVENQNQTDESVENETPRRRGRRTKTPPSYSDAKELMSMVSHRLANDEGGGRNFANDGFASPSQLETAPSATLGLMIGECLNALFTREDSESARILGVIQDAISRGPQQVKLQSLIVAINKLAAAKGYELYDPAGDQSLPEYMQSIGMPDEKIARAQEIIDS